MLVFYYFLDLFYVFRFAKCSLIEGVNIMNESQNNLIDSSVDLLFVSLPESPLKDMQEVVINEIATNDILRYNMYHALTKHLK